MTAELDKKLRQFNEFFVVESQFHINVLPLASDFELPDMDTFEETMPHAFRVASEVNVVDAAALRHIRAIGQSAEALINFLTAQSKKIDILMSYVLSQQDDAKYRFVARHFGGGGLSFESHEAFDIGQFVELKIFLTQEATAVYCLAEVIKTEAMDDGSQMVSLLYNRIREDDREILVRASLHQQTKELRKMAEEREPKKPDTE